MSFMRSRRLACAMPGVAVAAVMAFSGSASAAPLPSESVTVAPAPIGASPNGIIMSDGRICNPRWGC